MSLKVKICGLRDPATIEAAQSFGADYIGFIFFAKSPRHLEIEQARHLRPLITPPTKLVAVTVDAPDAYLDEIVAQVQPDILQLHGSEPPERLEILKQRYHLPLIKAFSIRTQQDLQQVEQYRNIADHILFDAKAPQSADLPGGNGIAFDWTLLDGLDNEIDYMLSGGLNAHNIVDALKTTKPYAVDISSGVESAPGIKDINLINEFFNHLNQAETDNK